MPRGITGERLGLTLNPAHGRLLRVLAGAAGAELAWATTWEDLANRYIGPVLGLPELPVVLPCEYGAKAGTVVPWTNGRPWVWFDDSGRELEHADSSRR